jgi:hypothetical protein
MAPKRKADTVNTDAFDEYRNSIKGDPTPEQLRELGRLIRVENGFQDYPASSYEEILIDDNFSEMD